MQQVCFLWTALITAAFWQRLDAHQTLNNKTLTLLPIQLPVYVMVTRNSTGQVIDAGGIAVETMRWLSRFLHFEFTMFNELSFLYDNSSHGRGGKSYLLSGQVDVALAVVLMTPERNRETDFPFPWAIGSHNMIMPFPKASTNISAPWKPFNFQVWMLLLASIIIVISSLRWANGTNESSSRDNYFNNYRRSCDYIITVFFSQGGVCYPTITRIRLIVAAWCLAAFVLTSIYNTTLISYVTSPTWQPLVRSVFDIPRNPRVRIVIDEHMGLEKFFLEAESGLYYEFGEMLKRDPSLRCSKTEECLNKVKTGSYVYIQSISLLKLYINKEFKSTRQCSMTLGKDDFLFNYASFVLPKGSPYTSAFSYGIISLRQTGLPGLWQSWFVPDSKQCIHFNSKPSKPRLSMHHLTSAFLILLIGYGISFVVFLYEHLRQFIICRY